MSAQRSFWSPVCRASLGGEYARAFLQRGARVVGLDIRPSAGSELLAKDFSGRYLFCVADVTDKASVQVALSTISSHFGTPSVLINNAAIDSPPSAPLEENGPFEEYPESSWDKVLDVNLKGMFLCCQVFGAAMAREGRGSIINIASVYGMVSPDQNLYEYRRQRGEIFFKPVAYAVSKSGVYNLSRYLAVYWAQKGCARQFTYHRRCFQPSGAGLSQCVLQANSGGAYGAAE